MMTQARVVDESPEEAAKALKEWLEGVSEPNVDPWPDGEVDPSPLSADAKAIDPFHWVRVFRIWRKPSPCDQGGGGDGAPEHHPKRSAGVAFAQQFRGSVDASGFLNSFGTAVFDGGDSITCRFSHGIRQGSVVLISPRNDITRLCGTCDSEDGRLQGRGVVISGDTAVTDCFFKDGVIHGPVRRIEMRRFREFRQQLTFIGTYLNGVPAGGPCLEYREGGGYLYGEPDPADGGYLTGDRVVYLYPDLLTGFQGRFERARMARGKACTLHRVELFRGKVPDVSCRLIDPEGQTTTLRHCPSTRTEMGEDFLCRDPYESRYVECRESGIPGSGQGLFAKADLPAKAIVAFYNGVRLPFELSPPGTGKAPEEWATSGYKIHVNADFTSGLRMDIPAEMTSLDRYCATLGHKMNHSFEANCEEWFMDHPRFGIIPCERTKWPVRRGQELTLDYEYDPLNCPDWFRAALDQFCREVTAAAAAEVDDADGVAAAIGVEGRLNPKYRNFLRDVMVEKIVDSASEH